MDFFQGLWSVGFELLPFVFLVVVISLTVHEFAHAYSADKFGDPTPRSMGRVTLDPRKHLDVLGTILIFLVGFGWAKPVMVRPGNFRKPRFMSVIVSFAGPFSNLVLAFVSFFIANLVYAFRVDQFVSTGTIDAINTFLGLMVSINIVLFLFNLLPLPPLDGYRIVTEFLPLRQRLLLQQYEQWAVYLFMLMVFIPPLHYATIGQIFKLSEPIIRGMSVFIIPIIDLLT